MRIFRDWSEDLINDILRAAPETGINVIGMDFGHGECAASMLALEGGELKIVPLRLNSREDLKMPTSAFIHESYRPNDDDAAARAKNKIGSDAAAVAASPMGSEGDYYVHFKAHPAYRAHYARCDGDVPKVPRSKGEVTHAFMQAFLDQLANPNVRPFNSALDLQKRTVLLVGRPAGAKWEDCEQAYRDVLLGDGLTLAGAPLIDLIVLSESLSALSLSLSLNARQYSADGIGFSDTVMCVDMGSSTSDITIIAAGRDVCEFSMPLGASLIDNNMLDYALSADNPNNMGQAYAREEIVGRVGVALDYARHAKERYYGDATLAGDGHGYMNVRVARADSGKRQARTLTLDVDEICMRHVLREMPVTINDLGGPRQYPSWLAACESFYRDVSCQLAASANAGGDIARVRKVILTGGASNMTHVRALAGEIFGAGLVECSYEPSFTVSKGLTCIAKYAASTEKALYSLRRELGSIVSENISQPESLYALLARTVSALLIDEVLYPGLDEWAKSGDGQSLNQRLELLNLRARAYMAGDGFKLRVCEAAREWIAERVSLRGIDERVNGRISELFGMTLGESEGVTISDDMFDSVAQKARAIVIDMNKDNCVSQGLSSLLQMLWGRITGSYGFMDRASHNEPWRRAKVESARQWRAQISDSLDGNYLAQLKAMRLLDDMAHALGDSVFAAIETQINEIAMRVYWHEVASED